MADVLSVIADVLKQDKQQKREHNKIMREVQKKLKEKDSEEVAEEEGDKEEYMKFFAAKLKKYGVKSPSELSDEDKKKFFDEIDKGWKGDNEKPEPGDKKEESLGKRVKARMEAEDEKPYTDIRKILKNAQMPNKKIRKLLEGEFVPANFSEARFKKKVKVLEDQARRMTKDNPDLKYYLDEDYAYPKDLLNDIKYDWKDRSLITETKEEEPGLIKKGIKKTWDRINPLKGFEGFDSLLRSEKIETPPLPPTSMPDKKLLTQSPQKINGLTRSEQALLSPSDKVIARRT